MADVDGAMESFAVVVHDAWWQESQRQGVLHKSQVPYADLPENVKEYDRVMIRASLSRLGFPPGFVPEEGAVGKAVEAVRDAAVLVPESYDDIQELLTEALRLLGGEEKR